ncbi:hypothetical protein DRN62_01080 [Nanoarchaeota archaeon]|nr:MAG: hypothetical protein DRN62_01080 [Nanoarchaeota archaeon]
MEVSVIILSKNEGEKVVKTVKSILNQDFQDFEVIVVDSSDDGTRHKLRSIKDERLRLYHLKEEGIAKARNFGIRKAKGRIVVFVDVGYTADRNWLKELLRSLKKSDSVGAGGSFKRGKEGLISGFVHRDRSFRLGEKRKYVNVLSTNNSAFYKIALEEVGGFDERFKARGEDSDLCYRLVQRGYKLLLDPQIKLWDEHDYSLKEFLKKQYLNGKYHLFLYLKHPRRGLGDSYRGFGFLSQALLPFLLLLSMFFHDPLPAILFFPSLFLTNAKFFLSNLKFFLTDYALSSLRSFFAFLGIMAGCFEVVHLKLINFTKILSLMKDRHYLILLFFLSMSTLFFLPTKYHETDFVNPLLLDGFIFPEERSELAFYQLKNLYFNHTFYLDENFSAALRLNESADVGKKDGKYYPLERLYYFIFELPFASLGFSLNDDVLAYKSLLLSNYFFFSLSLCFFYLLQRKLGMKEKFAFFSSLSFGFATGFVIYTRFFFSQILEFLLMISTYLLYVLGNVLYALPLFFLCLASPLYLVRVFLPLLFLRFDGKTLKIITLVLLLSLVVRWLTYPVDFPFIQTYFIKGDFETKWKYVPYASFKNLTGLSIEYMDSINKTYASIYENRGGIFLNSYGPFGALFSEKGFVYNSPFLIFSIWALFLRKRRWFNFLVLTFLINMLISILPCGWHGGSTPRYVRLYFPAICVLSFFSFHFLQHNRHKLLSFLFLSLLMISYLNVLNLSVRLDWQYEVPKDSPGFGWVLWSSTSEVRPKNWELLGEESCVAVVDERGLITDPCECDQNSWAEVMVYLTSNKTLHLLACADFAGGDGTKGYVYIDSGKYEIYIPSESCVEWNASVPKGKHRLRLQSGIHGSCDAEATLWENVILS